MIPCVFMGYAPDMEERRKTLGRRIKRARQRAGFTSQRAFAQAVGVDTTSVANAETGGEQIAVGGKVYAAIEDALGWPEDSTTRYLETGDESHLPSPTGDTVSARPTLTAEQKELLRVYREEYVPKYGPAEAQRRLQQDVDVLNAAIERDKRTAG